MITPKQWKEFLEWREKLADKMLSDPNEQIRVVPRTTEACLDWLVEGEEEYPTMRFSEERFTEDDLTYERVE